MTIRARLILAFCLLAVFGFYELVIWSIEDVRARYFAGMEETMVDTATLLASLIENEMTSDSIYADDLSRAMETAEKRRFSAQIYELTKTHMNLRVYITNDHGMVIYDSDGGADEGKDYSRWNNIVRTLRGEYGARATRADPEDPMSAVFHVSSPILLNGRIAGVLTVCKPAGSVSVFVHAARWEIAVAGAFVAGAVIVLSIVVTFWITRPIARLTQYAQAIRDGRRPSAPRLGSSEIGALGAAFEEMRTALEGKQYVEEYVQSLTHQMKSPLSAIRGAAELLEEDMPAEQRRQFLRNLRGESERLQDLIDRMLQLSAVENRKELRDVEMIDLPGLLSEILAEMRPLLAARQVRVSGSGQKRAEIQGERFLIRQAITNLLQNAVDFTDEAGSIEVSAETHAGKAAVVVSDNGPGIPEYALDRVFDRFYSLRHPGTGRKSSGLGLAFVREVSALHGGRVQLVNRPEGGAKAVFELPERPPGVL